MTSTQYQQFVTVAECGSITKAAKRLMVAQPALTNQIKRLEEELGTALFIRHPRSVELTDAGRLFYRSAKRILQMEQRARSDIDLLSAGGGILRVGITRFLPDSEFFSLLKSYREQNPTCRISLHEGNLEHILKELESEIIELAIVTSTSRFPSGFSARLLTENQMYACWDRSSRYLPDAPAGTELPLSALCGVPLSIPRDLQQFVDDCFHEEGISPVIDAVSGTRFATLELAKITGGAAFLVLSRNSFPDTDMLCYPVRCPKVSTARYLVTHDEHVLTETARHFIRYL